MRVKSKALITQGYWIQYTCHLSLPRETNPFPTTNKTLPYFIFTVNKIHSNMFLDQYSNVYKLLSAIRENIKNVLFL